jgi:hypothetical protein
LCLSIKASAQTITDGLMMPKKTFCTGLMYGHDQWTDYWQGKTKRDNLNIGHITTQSLSWMGTYGITKKINVIAMLPYIKATPSAGTLHSMEGIQDLTIAGKYNFLEVNFDSTSALKAFAGLAVSTPLTNYTPDFFPLSLGTSSTNLAWRLTLNYARKNGFYVNVSSAYTWRSNVKLDRPTYYTDSLYLTNEVRMPNVWDLFVTVGYHKKALQIEASYSQQNTLGGTDIRRQDMPFVSNRMNFSKVDALVMYYLPWPKNLAARGAVNYTIAGRNVGQSTTVMAGLMYTFYFNKN